MSKPEPLDIRAVIDDAGGPAALQRRLSVSHGILIPAQSLKTWHCTGSARRRPPQYVTQLIAHALQCHASARQSPPATT